MRVPRRSVALLGVAAFTVLLGATVIARGRDQTAQQPTASWRGLVGEPRAATKADQRMIVLLHTPSVAQRLAQVRYATESQERSWATQALAAQKQVLLKLATLGVTVQPDFSYERVLDGFSAALDPRAVALLGQFTEVSGVYPVRTAYPASISESLLSTKSFDEASGHRPDAELPGYDGRGVTIALLDTGVDEAHPYLRAKVLSGIDVVSNGEDATARSNPQDPSQIERHGTEMAGILVGSGGPGGLHGVAPGATVLPIRVAGWQAAADGTQVVYSRTDQMIAGLDRAVDPNGDGDTHDAVRVALLGVAEPYAAFTDGPEAQAVQGALDLNTVVVAPAGNDGGAGPAFGSIAGPGGAPGALAVGATDSRADQPRVRVVLRRGLDVILDEKLPLLGASAPHHVLSLPVATARGTGSESVDYFNAKGFSTVAGRAVVVPTGANPQASAIAASRAGASAVVLYGDPLPAGSLRVAEEETAPVVAVPAAAALELLAAQRAGIDVGIAIGKVQNASNAERGQVAPFSSQGLAFDSGVKPDVAAPGIAIATSEPGAATDGSPLYGTINGTSASAATVAGSAALLAQMRPDLDGASLDSLLVGYAKPGASATAVGAGMFDIGTSAVGEVAAQPTTFGFGVWQGARWHATRTITVRNVSSRRLQLSFSAITNYESEALKFMVKPTHAVLPQGKAVRVQITVRAAAAADTKIVTGALEVSPAGSQTLRVPWALDFAPPSDSLLGRVTIDRASFPASDTEPAVLSVQAGSVTRDHGLQIQPVARLDILLYAASGQYLGVMARLRDLLPGSYSFGITGRGPTSARLAPGSYELRLAAWPTLPRPAKPSRAQVRFKIE
jgi:hypothetical protein